MAVKESGFKFRDDGATTGPTCRDPSRSRVYRHLHKRTYLEIGRQAQRQNGRLTLTLTSDVLLLLRCCYFGGSLILSLCLYSRRGEKSTAQSQYKQTSDPCLSMLTLEKHGLNILNEGCIILMQSATSTYKHC